MKTYKMKELGYKRTPAGKMRIVAEYETGEKWAFPAQIVADSRDEAYADEEEDTIGFILAGSLNEYELIDWASNNMDWKDFAAYAEKIAESRMLNLESEWTNCDKTIEKASK